MLEDKWAEKRDGWVWSIFLESKGVWWWIMKTGRVRVKRLLVIKGDAVHCVDRPSHERIWSFVARNKALLHWSLTSPGDSWKIQVRPPGLTVLIQHYMEVNTSYTLCPTIGYVTGTFHMACTFHLMLLLPYWAPYLHTSNPGIKSRPSCYEHHASHSAALTSCHQCLPANLMFLCWSISSVTFAAGYKKPLDQVRAIQEALNWQNSIFLPVCFAFCCVAPLFVT